MSVADDIKRCYIRPAISRGEVEWSGRKGHRGALFCVEDKIWLDAKTSEYRIAIPEDVSFHKFDESLSREYRDKTLQMRFLTYVPTGRIVYDNSLPEMRAVVWEYELKHSRDLTK